MNNNLIANRIFNTGKEIVTAVNTPVYKGSMHLTSSAQTTCAIAGQYYKINGTFTDGSNKGFTTSVDGVLTCTVGVEIDCMLTGVTDVTANKNCGLTYAMYLNGILIPTAITPVDINNSGKYKSAAINRVLSAVTSPMAFDVWVKSDTENTIVTVAALMVTIWGDR